MQVLVVPCRSDNFAYLLTCPESGETAVVDPTDAAPVIAAIEEHGLTLTTILNTHHHYDHVGGNEELCQRYGKLNVYGYHADRGRIPQQTAFLKDGDPVRFGNQHGSFTHNPGHTTGAVTYYFGDKAFTGDTLFAGGCGRLFEGSPAEMYESLNLKIGSHPPDTKLYFGHEYTQKNLEFALTVEPDNQALHAKLEKVKEQRRHGYFTTPTTVADEFATNPFMRCDALQVKETVKKVEPNNDLSPAEVLRVIRALKDKF